MHFLAIETTGLAGSVAALDDRNPLADIDLPQDQGSSRALAPAIQRLLAAVGWRPKDVQVVAVVIGPGSFTGLRVGVTAAKTFAYVTGAEVLGLDTLEVVAATAPPEIARLSVAVDAQRGEVVAGDFVRASDGSMRPSGPEQLLDVEKWWAGLPPGTLVTGPVLRQVISRLPATWLPWTRSTGFPRRSRPGVWRRGCMRPAAATISGPSCPATRAPVRPRRRETAN